MEEEFKSTFESPYDQYKHRNGHEFTVLRKIDKPDDTHDEEVLPMYEIQFKDGEIIEAWPEEVVK